MSKKKQSAIPSINIHGDDFIHEVPENLNLEVIIHWKGKGFEPEHINPIHAFGLQDGKFKVINRNLKDTCYTFLVKEIKTVYLLPMDI